MTYEEIANAIHIKPENAKMRVSRARKKVLALLDNETKLKTD